MLVVLPVTKLTMMKHWRMKVTYLWTIWEIMSRMGVNTLSMCPVEAFFSWLAVDF